MITRFESANDRGGLGLRNGKGRSIKAETNYKKRQK
jgi:hypothetical protein